MESLLSSLCCHFSLFGLKFAITWAIIHHVMIHVDFILKRPASHTIRVRLFEVLLPTLENKTKSGSALPKNNMGLSGLDISNSNALIRFKIVCREWANSMAYSNMLKWYIFLLVWNEPTGILIKIAFEYANDSILNAYFPHFKSVISPIWCPKSAMRLHSKGVLSRICWFHLQWKDIPNLLLQKLTDSFDSV